MRRRNIRTGKSNMRKEKAVMIASTVLVLSALTVTGLYVRNDNQKSDDGYTVDLSTLEEEDTSLSHVNVEEQPNNDMDYDPASMEVDSGTVKNVSPKEDLSEVAKAGNEPGSITAFTGEQDGLKAGSKDGESVAIAEPIGESAEQSTEPDAEEASADAVTENTSTSEATVSYPEPHFSETDSLLMPLSGNILMNYSMDKSVYFQTLQQYKYNPAVIIEAAVGSTVKAAATGVVTSISYRAETGNTVVMSIGDGYEVTYGQLENINVSEGTYVTSGTDFATVAAPTRYYTTEGSNLYLKMTKDGTAVNPIAQE